MISSAACGSFNGPGWGAKEASVGSFKPFSAAAGPASCRLLLPSDELDADLAGSGLGASLSVMHAFPSVALVVDFAAEMAAELTTRI